MFIFIHPLFLEDILYKNKGVYLEQQQQQQTHKQTWYLESKGSNKREAKGSIKMMVKDFKKDQYSRNSYPDWSYPDVYK